MLHVKRQIDSTLQLQMGTWKASWLLTRTMTMGETADHWPKNLHKQKQSSLAALGRSWTGLRALQARVTRQLRLARVQEKSCGMAMLQVVQPTQQNSSLRVSNLQAEHMPFVVLAGIIKLTWKRAHMQIAACFPCTEQ